ncbi:hypothetical protein GCM10009584_09650 [Ornithinimicrobium humiphilum]
MSAVSQLSHSARTGVETKRRLTWKFGQVFTLRVICITAGSDGRRRVCDDGSDRLRRALWCRAGAGLRRHHDPREASMSKRARKRRDRKKKGANHGRKPNA